MLGLAPARRAWFQDVARWSTAAMLPLEFVKCVALDELRVRLSSGRPFSAVLVDAGVPGVDRDLADAARRAGCALLVVDDERAQRDWSAMGAAGVLPSPLDRHDLLAALKDHAAPIARGEATAVPADTDDAGWRGDLVAVTGARGAGTSVVAMAIAQGLAADPRHAGLVVLADLALDADQALLHDSGDVVPGLQELVDAHRMGSPSADEVRTLTWDVRDRGYSLLLGLRRHRDWAALRPRAIGAAIDGLRRAYRAVVADVDPDVEGEAQCGSADVEERNALARTAVLQAGAVVAVGTPGTKGVHSLVRVVDGLLDIGVLPQRVVTVVNRAPRSPRARAEITRTLAELRRDTSLATPVFALERRRLDDLLRDGERLPSSFANPLGATVAAILERPTAAPPPTEPEPVGSIGAWSDA